MSVFGGIAVVIRPLRTLSQPLPLTRDYSPLGDLSTIIALSNGRWSGHDGRWRRCLLGYRQNSTAESRSADTAQCKIDGSIPRSHPAGFFVLARRILLDTAGSDPSEFVSSAATFVPSCRFGSLKSSQRFSTAGLCNRERHSTGQIRRVSMNFLVTSTGGIMISWPQACPRSRGG